MKKILSIISITLCFIMLLSGCSQNEIGLINLCEELQNTQKLKVAGNFNFSENSNSIATDFSGLVDLEEKNPYIDLNFNLNVKNENISITNARIIADKEKVFFSKNLIEAIIVYENPDIKNIFEKISKDANYYYVKQGELASSGITMQTYNFSDKQKQEFLNTFKDFETGLVSNINNGYEITLTEKDIVPLLEKTIHFISNNKETIYDYFINLIREYYNQYIEIIPAEDIAELEIPTIDEIIKEIDTGKEEVFIFIDELASAFTTEIKKSMEESLNEIEGSYYKQSIVKENNEYKVSTELVFKYEDYEFAGEYLDGMTKVEKTVSVSGNVIATPMAEITREQINGAVELNETFDATIDKEYQKLFPTKKMTITWYSNENNTAYVESYNTKEEMTYAIKEMLLQDDRVYLPMRYIAEAFGEQVVWDAQNSKAYVVLDSANIDMSGIIKDGTTYVKIRDFEKLGYKVDYINNGIENTATIIKGY